MLARGPRSQPVCSTIVSPIDARPNRLRCNPFSPDLLQAPNCTDTVSGVEEFLDAVTTLISRYFVKPHWDAATLLWQLESAATKEKSGDLKRRLGRKGSCTIGGFSYYSRPRGVGLYCRFLQSRSINRCCD